ncbi:MAG: VIT1/CCC1 transporter family protein [Candidatus Methylomirabilia bacterium]
MAHQPQDLALARQLILDELLDLSLYEALRESTSGDLRQMIEELIPIETKHFAFWQEFFGMRLERLDFRRRLKLALLLLGCRTFGAPAIHLTLEAIEVYGIRKYLSVWGRYRDTTLGAAVRDVLEDEFRHEERVVTERIERRIDPERIRNIFLGFNDGLVEILGAVSGFFAAFQSSGPVLIAGFTAAVAGSLSMAAGAYVASSSEEEVKTLEAEKKAFLAQAGPAGDAARRALGAALLVGGSYVVGAVIPLAPVLLGARSLLFPILAAGTMIILVSFLLAFLSGMVIRKRIVTNLVIIAVAVGVTYAIGTAAKLLWGIGL